MRNKKLARDDLSTSHRRNPPRKLVGAGGVSGSGSKRQQKPKLAKKKHRAVEEELGDVIDFLSMPKMEYEVYHEKNPYVRAQDVSAFEMP